MGGPGAHPKKFMESPKPKNSCGGFLILFPKISGATKPKIGIWKFLTPFPKISDPKIHLWWVLDLVPKGLWCPQIQTRLWDVLDLVPKDLWSLQTQNHLW